MMIEKKYHHTSPQKIFCTRLWKHIFLSIFILLTVSSVRAEVEPLDSVYVDEIPLIVGELEQIKVYNLTRVSMTDPSIADIVDADTEELVIIGKEPGVTSLFVWDDHGKTTINISVFRTNLKYLKTRLERLFESKGIKGLVVTEDKKEGKVVLSGAVLQDDFDFIEEFLVNYVDDVINMTRVESSNDMVQIDMQVTELSQTLSETLGFDWVSGSGNDTNITDGNLNPTITEIALPSQDGSFSDLFKLGDFNRTQRLQATINMIIEEGKGRILSKPKLVVKSGEEATFLVGGEVPIRTTTTASSGGLQENVDFKEYGIGMTITPTITQGKIDILLNTEISEIDRANAVGSDVAFTTRTAQTHLYVDDRQTVILAGLIKQSEGNTIKKVPVLGDVPVLGFFFRSRTKVVPDEDTEIVVSLIPTILSKKTTPKEDAFAAAHLAEFPAPLSIETDEHFLVDSSSSVPEPMVNYIQSVQRKISTSVIYPSEAEDLGWEGTVEVGLNILRDGTLGFAMVKTSSGYDVFDDYAVHTAKHVAPYEAFPDNVSMDEINITVPIVYKLSQIK